MDNFLKIQKQYKEDIDNRMVEIFRNKKPTILYEPMGYAVQIGGKRLRPFLCNIFCDLFSENLNPVLYPAIAIELLHNFTLIHDDIMDRDPLRRGQPTVYKKWDIAAGILSGDGMLGVAYRILFEEKLANANEVLTVFTDSVIEVCEGQGFDKEFEDRDDVTEDEYIDMIDKKTGALLSAAGRLGVLTVSNDPKFIDIADRYGRALGIAFQIQDDYLDIATEEKVLGKTYGSDVQEGKKTFLYIKALNMVTGKDKQLLIDIVEKNGASLEEILTVKNIYEKYGVLKVTEIEVENRIQLALEILSEIPSNYDVTMLEKFTNYILKRKF